MNNDERTNDKTWGGEKRERERELEWDRIIKVLWLLQKEKKKQY